MNFFDHKDLGNHLLQLCPKVVKHPVYIKRETERYNRRAILVFKIVALLECYAAYICSYLPTFRDNLSGPTTRIILLEP